MSALKINKKKADRYEQILKSEGEAGFYQFILGNESTARRIDYALPEVMFLDMADAFFTLSRRNNNNNYFIIGKILRRAAHKLYRTYRSVNAHPFNKRFLNLIK